MVTEATELREEATELIQTDLHDVLLNYRSKVWKYVFYASFFFFSLSSFLSKEVLGDEWAFSGKLDKELRTVITCSDRLVNLNGEEMFHSLPFYFLQFDKVEINLSSPC